MEERKVRAGKDTILSGPDRVSSIDAIAELIWNGLDADATRVEVVLTLGELGAPQEITVVDNGRGMTYAKAVEVFELHGDSWKAQAKFSAGGRPLHGRMGRGRFLAYTLGTRAEWRTVAETDSGRARTVVHGSRLSPEIFRFDGPDDTSDAIGTEVSIRARDEQKVARLADGNVVLPLTAKLAATLMALPDVQVTYQGQLLDPRVEIFDEHELHVDLDPSVLRGHAAPVLKLIEWKQDMRLPVVMLCDAAGAVATQHKPERLPIAPVYWTAYLHWEGFSDPALMGPADLEHPDIQHGILLAAVRGAIAEFLERRLAERKGEIIAEWKAERVYPYSGDPSSTTEEIERDLFDVVAVIASPSIGKAADQKKLSLRLLREAIRSEPGRTTKALGALLNLAEEDAEALDALLGRTSLESVIRASSTITDRLDFVFALEQLLYSDETRRVFREVDQLHPMVVREPWVFGDEWQLALSESGLSGVVKAVLSKLGKDVEYAPGPVTLPSGKQGRVDLVFHRFLPETESNRHLVVELKRPMKVGMAEYGQLNNYATAITERPEVLADRNRWDFWLVCSDIDPAVMNLRTDPLNPGLTATTSNYRLYVIMWSELLDGCRRRLEALREQLDVVPTTQTARAYLHKVHADFVPEAALVCDGSG